MTNQPLVLGHRGTGSGTGENTLAAFAGALDAGADGVELDVRRTRDGALALVHDPVIDGLGAVAELSAAELPPSVPLLETALDLCSTAVLVDIEIKNFPGEPGYDSDELTALAVAARLLERDAPPVLVTSFTAPSLDAVLSVAPEIPTGLLVHSRASAESSLRLAVERGYAAIVPHFRLVTAGLVADALAAGLAVYTWTVNEPEDATAVIRAGVNGVITDRIDVVNGAAAIGAVPAPIERAAGE